jgi:predicted N-acetyltransferase YhbS
MISYRHGNALEIDAVIELYRASTLGARRPVNDPQRMSAMLQNAPLVVTAWDGAQMVGIARALSDFSYCTYLADLAVRLSHQRQGIGRELIRQVQQAGGSRTHLFLFAAPGAEEYYGRVGFTQHPSGWVLAAEESVR